MLIFLKLRVKPCGVKLSAEGWFLRTAVLRVDAKHLLKVNFQWEFIVTH